MDIERLKLEHEETVTVLHAERRCLLTTIEVLEADLETLRLEVGSMSAREKQSQAAADIYTELSLAALNIDEPRTVATTAVASPTLLPTSATPQTQPGGNFGGDLKKYLAQLAPTSPPQKATSVAPTPETGESSGTGAVGGCPDDLGRPGVVDTSRLSGNLHASEGEATNSESRT
ncbi:hypothetical protein J6590_062203 [Homalodisca vitripennis]|nr:hypothetical protein J6590_062203 [Homalodisca vitripennis]